MTDIYDEVIKRGIEHSHHASDLYVPVTPETTELVAQYKFRINVTKFTNQVSKTQWYNIPFAYQPFWDDVAEKKERAMSIGGDSVKYAVRHKPTGLVLNGQWHDKVSDAKLMCDHMNKLAGHEYEIVRLDGSGSITTYVGD